MLMALEALSRSAVRIIRLADETRDRAGLVARCIPGSTCAARAITSV